MLFENIQLEPEEVILTMVRKHWYVIGLELFGTLSLISIPFLLMLATSLIPNDLFSSSFSLGDYSGVIVFVTAAWTLLCLLATFMIWTHYYLDLWIITDRRIILIDQINFFNRNVSIFRLERLQDIEYYINGIIPTFLNFGTLKAQTAGHFESNFSSTGLPDPRGLQATIQKAMDARLQALHVSPNIVE